MSIRARLLALFGLLVALGMSAFFGLWLYGLPGLGVEGMQSHEYRRAVVSVEAVADKERDRLEVWFENHRRELRLLSADEAFVRDVKGMQGRSGAATELSRRLTSLKEASPGTYRMVRVVAATGGRVLARSVDGTQNHADLPAWLQEAAEPGMRESVHLFMQDGSPQVMVINQIVSVDGQGIAEGKVLGLLVAQLALASPFQQAELGIHQALGETGAVLLVDRDARVMLKVALAQSDEDSQAVAREVVSGTEGMRLLTTAQGKETIAVFRYVHLGASDEVSIAATRGTDDALAVIRGSFVRMFGVLAAFFVLSMALVVFAANRIARAEAQVRSLNASLEHRIQARTMELATANEDLRHTLLRLERAQDELVRSEKMAALGSLVAGVAHELNTPIGTCLTVASSLAHETTHFQEELEKGLRRSTLERYVSHNCEGTDILMHSLTRAAELISSFKQVAVDQSSLNRRQFRLRDTFNEILLTLGPTLRKTTHRVELDVVNDVVMDSYPGPIGQILTNLVHNALIHGLSTSENGVIQIQAHLLSDDQVGITLKDSGVGIPEEYLARVFDPFFTTRLGHGGSGLGLHIVYNLATKTLGGTIEVTSPPGQGACFRMALPLVAPERSATTD